MCGINLHLIQVLFFSQNVVSIPAANEPSFTSDPAIQGILWVTNSKVAQDTAASLGQPRYLPITLVAGEAPARPGHVAEKSMGLPMVILWFAAIDSCPYSNNKWHVNLLI